MEEWSISATFIISTLDGGECRLYDAAVLPLLEAPTIHCVRGWVIPEPVWVMWGRERFLLNFDSLFIWPVNQSLW
jgi:hypothetical protein